jgi:hypothetical protein
MAEFVRAEIARVVKRKFHKATLPRLSEKACPQRGIKKFGEQGNQVKIRHGGSMPHGTLSCKLAIKLKQAA